jgi:hypothetical protein
MSTKKAGTNHRAYESHIHAVPTPDEIDAVIADLIATWAAEAARSFERLNASWSAVAIDPRTGRRGDGEGLTPAKACVKAWISLWLRPADELLPGEEDDFSEVPRVVPEGWTFRVYPPGQIGRDKAG